jgi:UrcA family protein
METTMNTTHFLLAPWKARRALVAGLAVCLTLAVPVTRAADGDPRSAMVQFADLNLTHPEGVKKLYARITWAAGQVCRDADRRGSEEKAQFRSCLRESIDRAVVAVGNPALAAFHEAKAGPSTKRPSEFAQR